MASARVEVLRLEVVREEIDYAHADVAEALELLYPPGGRGKSARLPLAPARLSLELRGVPTAVANALRRVLAQELTGACLTFDRAGFDREATTDPFMADDEFVRGRLRMVPLAPHIPPNVARDLRYTLHATNTTEEVMTLYAGDLVLAAGNSRPPSSTPPTSSPSSSPAGPSVSATSASPRAPRPRTRRTPSRSGRSRAPSIWRKSRAPPPTRRGVRPKTRAATQRAR